jgi:hypothetical protein
MTAPSSFLPKWVNEFGLGANSARCIRSFHRFIKLKALASAQSELLCEYAKVITFSSA